MNRIRPVSDLRNNFADISRTVHETAQPVFLTKNGYGDMVVLSMEAYENLRFDSDVYFQLREAEQEEQETEQRYSSQEVFAAMRKIVEEATPCTD
jgi:prevent-host-death family protein